jgi:hypothetical protein
MEEANEVWNNRYRYRKRKDWNQGNSINNIGPVTLSVEQWYRYRDRDGRGLGSGGTNGSKGNSVKNIGPATL